jgi:hypothetical protein
VVNAQEARSGIALLITVTAPNAERRYLIKGQNHSPEIWRLHTLRLKDGKGSRE